MGEPILGGPSSHTFLFMVHLISMVHLKSVKQWTMVHILPMRQKFEFRAFLISHGLLRVAHGTVC